MRSATRGEGSTAVVIGEPQRAFYGNQFGLTFPVFVHYGVQLWVPEVGGPVDPGSEAHDLVMNLFGGMSKGERMRIKTRVRAAMSSQTAAEGRFLGGRPPYGYRLVAIGPHPHPEKAAAGIQLKALDPDPAIAPIVKRIYKDFLAGKGYFAIAEELSAESIPSPSAHDRRRNPHRPGRTWAKSAVRAILQNPRYTGYQVWGKQRRDEVLLDVEDVAAGHETRMRWNAHDRWIWSQEPAHEAIIGRDEFDAVQAIIASRTRATGPRRRKGRRNVYLLRGLLRCGLCGRLMQGQQNHNEPYYRCKYSDEYARSAELDHPKNIYLREASIINTIDDWLADLFNPDRLDATLDLLLEAVEDDDALTTRITTTEESIAEANQKLGRYRTLLDNGADPATVTEWIAETTAERAVAERQLTQLRASAGTLDRAELVHILDDVGGMIPLLHTADRAQRARFYEAVRLTGTFDPEANKLHLTTKPGGDMVRVGGGT